MPQLENNLEYVDVICPTKYRKYEQQDGLRSKAKSGDFLGMKNVTSFGVEYSKYHHEKGQSVRNAGVILQRVSLLYGDVELSDIELIVGNRSYYSHKLVLSMSSDVLKIMLTDDKWTEAHNKTIVLKEDTECYDVFEDFLKYFYTGMIQLDHSSVLEILKLADKYNVSDLSEICINYMQKHIVSLVETNKAVYWFQYANACGHNDLRDLCKSFITWNFHKIIYTTDFLSLEYERLLELIKSSEIVIPNEFCMYEAIKKWASYTENLPGVLYPRHRDIVCSLMRNLRFTMLQPGQLRQIKGDIHDSYILSIIEPFIDNALQYHNATNEDRLCDSYHVREVRANPELYAARNYTSDFWSASFIIDNYSEFPVNNMRPFLFSSPLSSSMADEDHYWDWNVDFYPKGVHFQKCLMIGLQENFEIPDTVYDTARISIASVVPSEVRNAIVSILIFGVQDGVEYVKHVVEKRCNFDEDNRIHILNDIVNYHELNCEGSDYLCDFNGDAFKVLIIIKPAMIL